jgi:hypothetical protein
VRGAGRCACSALQPAVLEGLRLGGEAAVIVAPWPNGASSTAAGSARRYAIARKAPRPLNLSGAVHRVVAAAKRGVPVAVHWCVADRAPGRRRSAPVSAQLRGAPGGHSALPRTSSRVRWCNGSSAKACAHVRGGARRAGPRPPGRRRPSRAMRRAEPCVDPARPLCDPSRRSAATATHSLRRDRRAPRLPARRRCQKG